MSVGPGEAGDTRDVRNIMEWLENGTRFQNCAVEQRFVRRQLPY